MKICITSSGSGLDSLVDPRFGRCPFFIFIDDENEKKFSAVKNPGIDSLRGAGVQSAQTIISQKAEVVITGNIGPNSLEVLNNSGIKIFQAAPEAKIKDALSAFKQNELPEMTQSVRAGFGAPGRGRGLGRDLGRNRR